MTDHSPNHPHADAGRPPRSRLLTDAFDGKLLTPDQAADLLDVTVEDLEDLRAAGTGPRCGVLSPQIIRYHRDDLLTWQTTSTPPPAGNQRELEASPQTDPAFETAFGLLLQLSENAEHTLDPTNCRILATAFNEFSDYGALYPEYVPAPNDDLGTTAAARLLSALTTHLTQMAADADDLPTVLRLARTLDLVTTITVTGTSR